MIRSKLMTGFLAIAFALLLQVCPALVRSTHAQGSRKDDIVFNTRGVPLAGATVRVCAMPATGQPCTPLALIYSDSGLTQALSNPTTTDGLGNYSFYASPGKYEIEISGPGITTKQLPNVILPSDPASPTFSSLNSTGAINAFSLSLTGNLTVNGSTTVIGNLASGTLNITNQATPPGAASSGTVNLYTKTADKRLYYKDDTGTETGPIASGSGAQTNTPNTFTAPQSIAADFHTKGPNPSYDLSLNGGYTGDNYKTPVTGTINSGSSTLSISSALDFANNQGILVLAAGPAPSIATPSGVVVTPQGVNGSTSYYYCVVDEDYKNGRTACSSAGSTSTGASALGITTAAISNKQRTSGVTTITTSAAHNFQTGFVVNVTGTGDSNIEGAITITSVPSSTTFTYNQTGTADIPSTPISGSAQVAARNFVQWNAPTAYTTLKHFIYRCTSSCGSIGSNYALAGVAVGMDSSFVDYGFAVPASNVDIGDVPATAPTAASNQWLSTTITSGGGTTSLTLATTASNSATGVNVFHDNTPIILGFCTLFNAGSFSNSSLFVPAPSTGTFPHFPINSTLDMADNCSKQMEIDFGALLWLNGTIMVGGSENLKGVVSGNQSQLSPGYPTQPVAWISGYAYPLIYFIPNHSGGDVLNSLLLSCNQSYQPCIYQDADLTGAAATTIRYTDVFVNGGGNNTPYVAKGGFGYFWERGSWTINATSFNSPPAALFTVNCGLGQTGQELPAILYTEKTSVYGGIVMDSCGTSPSGSGGGNHMEFRELLMENAYVPVLRANTGAFTLYALNFLNVSYSDLLGGSSTPLFDLTNAKVAGIEIKHPFCATGYQPLFEMSNSVSAYNGIEVINSNGCNFIGGNYGWTRVSASSMDLYSNFQLGFSGANGRAFYLMSVPSPPQSAVVSSGGGVAVGAHTYAVTAVDFDGAETTLSTSVSATATTGNQTITVTLPATFPAGSAGLNIYRDGSLVNANGCTRPQFTTPGGTFVDTFGFACGGSPPLSNSAGQTTLSTNGISSAKVRIAGESLSAAPRGEQNIFLPGPLTSTWTASTWTPDKPITITRLQLQAKTSPSGCTTNAVVRLTDGSSPINLTLATAANDSGAITQNYTAGATLTVSVQTAAAGCTTSPADANLTIQYRMQ